MPKFVPRERKHRRLAKLKQNGVTSKPNAVDDANAAELAVISKDEKEERRRQLRDELKPAASGMSAKKKKRLDKYIDTKLKKEENLDLLKKLAAHKIDTSLLQSAKTLGRITESKKERIQRALRERQAGVDVDGQQGTILFEQRVPAAFSEGETDDEADLAQKESTVPESVASAVSNGLFGNTSFGTGLKRPLETDDSGQPLIKRRKRQKKPNGKKLEFGPVPDPDLVSSDEALEDLSDAASDEWRGFSGDEGEDDVSEGSMSEGSDEVDETDGSDDSSGEQEDNEHKPARMSAFKAWADSQRNIALDFTPSAVPAVDEAVKAAFKPRALSPDPVLSELVKSANRTEDAYRPSKPVVVTRDEKIEEARTQLPVVQDEQKIMEAINANSVTIVCGATGSGKTTQLPQMLFENGYASKGMIGITQPRRVAATSVAKRVEYELGPEFGKHVAHQVRFDKNVSRDTRIKFMTDGVLLREISQDFALSKYSAIVIDEAHERSVNTDILIGMLARIVPLRQELSKEASTKHHPLKLVIMSATLRVTDFLMNERLFRKAKPPIVQAEGRQFPVTEHFARKTQRDYVAEMVGKVAKGHKKLPPGDILVFLTGQDEIQTVAKRLQESITSESVGSQNFKSRPEARAPNDYLEDEDGSDSEPEITGLDDDDEDDAEFAVETDPASQQQRRIALKAQVLPLYASLPAAQQDRVFQKTPEGYRKIILSTNVAETSLTIDGVRYVFDCGRSKEKVYDVDTGVQQFTIDWISKASAFQRMGRAGRTGPGHCYRLYSSAIYERYFEEHTLPEILRTPIEGTVLQLKTMDVDKVANFPFPTPPAREQLIQAERLLKNLGAIDASTGKVLDLGRQLIDYPVNPRFAKMLLLGRNNNVLTHIIALVAGLAVGDLFIPEPRIQKDSDGESDSSDDDAAYKRAMGAAAQTAAEKRRQQYGRANATLSNWDDKADCIKVLTAVAAHAQAEEDKNTASFCAEYFLREKGMSEVQNLRRQLHNIMQSKTTDPATFAFKQVPPPPSDAQRSVIKQIVVAGYIDQVAIRRDLLPSAVVAGRKPRRAIEVAYRTLLPSTTGEIDHEAGIQDQELQKSVFTHSSSVLARLALSEMPQYIIYANLSRAAPNSVGEKNKRTRMHPLTTVTQRQLAALAEGTPLLEVGKPIGKIEDLEGGKKRRCWIGVSLRDPAAVGTTGWPLGAWKVLQSRKGKEWKVEDVIDRGQKK